MIRLTPEITIKAYRGVTRELTAVAPGTRVLLDGPHGSFRPPRCAGGFVLIAGAIGITPVMSLLRTHAAMNDPQPHLLFYASVGWDGVIFREELDELSDRMALRVVHVLNEPHHGWSGERGLVDQAILERHLPRDLSRARGLRVRTAGADRRSGPRAFRRRRPARTGPHRTLCPHLKTRRTQWLPTMDDETRWIATAVELCCLAAVVAFALIQTMA